MNAAQTWCTCGSLHADRNKTQVQAGSFVYWCTPLLVAKSSGLAKLNISCGRIGQSQAFPTLSNDHNGGGLEGPGDAAMLIRDVAAAVASVLENLSIRVCQFQQVSA